MAPARQASPMTWMFGADLDSKVTGSIAHQPVLSVAPAISAMRPARCGGIQLAPWAAGGAARWGGITLATWAGWLPKSVISVLVAGSTAFTLPPCDSDTHSIIPG